MKAILPENLSNAEKEKKNRVISNIETWPDSQAMLPVPGNAFGNEFKKHQDRTWTSRHTFECTFFLYTFSQGKLGSRAQILM